MLQKNTFQNGIVAFQSPLLLGHGIIHAFSTRIGGISQGRFSSLNLGNPQDGEQDPAANLAENFKRLQTALECPSATRAWVYQVHGRRVELLERESEGEYAGTLQAELRDRWSGQMSADAIIGAPVDEPVLLTIRVADCVPILLASADGRYVAAVHAGWRGVVGDILGRSVLALREAGAMGELLAAIGPCISVEHFEVGGEVAEEFQRQGLGECVRPPSATQIKPHIDLQAGVRTLLERAGVTQIDGNDLCTVRDADLFYSHRRDKGSTGRMAGVILAAANRV